jgi:hypothetical protein
MRTGLLIFFSGIFLAGCGRKDKVPNGILPQKKMQAVMWDMMRADQFLADYVLNKDTSLKKQNESIQLYQKIFLIHNIKKEVFQKSFSFYKNHPDLMKAIMDSISKMPLVTVDTMKQKMKTDSLLHKTDTIRKDTIINDTTRRFKGIKRIKRMPLK